jgi:hypothetical protein
MTQKLTPEEIRRSDPFLSGDDEIHLDTSSYPWMTPLADTPVEDELLDTRGMGVGSSALKKFLSNPDRESVVELRDPETLKKFDEETGAGALVYAGGVPFQIKQHQGRWHAKGTTEDGVEHRFTSATRDGLFPKISAAVKQGSVRELTKEEKLQVIRQAQGGDVQGAMHKFFEFAVGYERASRYENPYEMLSDPALADVFDECALLTWYASRSNVKDSPELAGYISDYAGERPLTHALLDAAHESFSERSHRLIYAPLKEPKPKPTPESLDNLSDQGIEDLLVKVAPGFVLAAQQTPRTYQKFPAAPADGGSLEQIDAAVRG